MVFLVWAMDTELEDEFAPGLRQVRARQPSSHKGGVFAERRQRGMGRDASEGMKIIRGWQVSLDLACADERERERESCGSQYCSSACFLSRVCVPAPVE